MNDNPTAPFPDPDARDHHCGRIALLAFLFLGVSLLAVSNQSLWIDELATAHFAALPTLKGMWQELVRLKWPEIQAPLYTVYTWSWDKVFGNGEWSLRFAGVPWFVLGASLFVSSFRDKTLRAFAFLAVSLSPFAWFYLNEARLYSMQLGLAFWVVGALLRLREGYLLKQPIETAWLAMFSVGVVLLSMVNVLGLIWASAAILVFLDIFSWRRSVRLVRDYWLLIGSCGLLLMVCGFYYLWTRRLGIMPSTVGRTDLNTLSFIAYEQLGFNGLGPGRLSLRAEGVGALKPWVPFLVVYALGVFLVCAAAVWQSLREKTFRTSLVLGLALMLPAGFLAAMGVLARFRILGRHFTPLETVVVLVYTLGAVSLWRSRNWWARSGLVAFLGLSLFSCLSQRFAARHARDDYRGAAQFAKTALQNGRSIWWNAEPFSCDYYHVPAARDWNDKAKAWLLFCPAADFAQGVPKPDLVFTSKPDVYDAQGSVHRFLEQAGYAPVQTLPAFVVFQNKADRGPAFASQQP